MKKEKFLMTGEEKLESSQFGLTNAEVKENNVSSGKLISHEKVPNSPFSIVELDSMGSFVAMGNDRISDFMSTKECWDLVSSKPWDLILASVTSLLTHILKDKKLID